MNASVLVLGLGNTLLSDEGVGVHTVRHLETLPNTPETVRFLDGGTLSFTLAGPIEEADQLIVVDAAELGAPPGTLRCFEGADMDAFLGSNRKRSVHEVSLLDLMAVSHLTGRLPSRRALLGIQPASTDWGEQPTAPVAAVIPAAAEQIRDLIERWRD
jgi:hydrogenase maturation protease